VKVILVEDSNKQLEFSCITPSHIIHTCPILFIHPDLCQQMPISLHPSHSLMMD
jgi:hypothetical protein